MCVFAFAFVRAQSWQTVLTPLGWSLEPELWRFMVRRSSSRFGTQPGRSASGLSPGPTTGGPRGPSWSMTSPGRGGGGGGHVSVGGFGNLESLFRRSTYNHLSSWLTDARNLTNPNTVRDTHLLVYLCEDLCRRRVHFLTLTWP